MTRFDLDSLRRLVTGLVRWTAIGGVVGAIAGLASATFLALLAQATETRVATPWLLWLLPLGGLVVGLLYTYVGGGADGGNNLILEHVHGTHRSPTVQGCWIPRRMAPLVLFGTLVTHLFGGSAGREGTAIQMSGSLNDIVARLLRLPDGERRLLLVAAIAGGFGSVFGVPLAGAVFALEVQAVGRLRHDALVPALVAAIVGNEVVHRLDWAHDLTPTTTLRGYGIEPGLMAKVALAGIAFGLVSAVFSELVAGIHRVAVTRVGWAPARPVVGGGLVIALTLVVGTRDYLGLSLPLIQDSLDGSDVVAGAFALKILFTVITLGSGFRGGEVTPLFVIGATLGATLGTLLGAPVELLAAVGLIAVFAGATKTPLACTVMGLELFGPGALLYMAVGCAVSVVASAHRGIYDAQLVHVDGEDAPVRLGDIRERRRQMRSARWR